MKDDLNLKPPIDNNMLLLPSGPTIEIDYALDDINDDVPPPYIEPVLADDQHDMIDDSDEEPEEYSDMSKVEDLLGMYILSNLK